jgi:hypothetical protein
MTRISQFRLTLAVVLAAVACSGERTTTTSAFKPEAPATSSSPEVPATASRSGVQGAGATLIECPPAATLTTKALIGPLGGVVAAGNTIVVVPADAVLFPTTFTLTVPSSKYVELDVKVEGVEHFTFAKPVNVTIDYGRCGGVIDNTTLSVWNIDPLTKDLLERMVSVDNKLARTITFTTLHFSGYAVAD